ncbi:ribose 5-phosphate isomerase B [bacterium]|nr:ribose 5-phosphate isomerase B [bacterium]
MNIAIGTDHRGFSLKQNLVQLLRVPKVDLEWTDVGCFSQDCCDYPQFARLVCEKVLNGKVDCGVLLCSTGIGMSIAANRFNGIYAALCWNTRIARLAKEHDNANVIVLPSDFVSFGEVQEIIKEWLSAEFKEGQYKKRLEILDSFK